MVEIMSEREWFSGREDGWRVMYKTRLAESWTVRKWNPAGDIVFFCIFIQDDFHLKLRFVKLLVSNCHRTSAQTETQLRRADQ